MRQSHAHDYPTGTVFSSLMIELYQDGLDVRPAERPRSGLGAAWSDTEGGTEGAECDPAGLARMRFLCRVDYGARPRRHTEPTERREAAWSGAE